MPKFTGKNLKVKIGDTVVPCPQSADVTPQQEFVEFYCGGSEYKSKVYDGTNWSGSVVWLPDNDDHADLTALNSSTALTCYVWPDGETEGLLQLSFSAFVSAGLGTQRSNPGSSTINLAISGDVTIAAVPGD